MYILNKPAAFSFGYPNIHHLTERSKDTALQKNKGNEKSRDATKADTYPLSSSSLTEGDRLPINMVVLFMLDGSFITALTAGAGTDTG